MSNRYIYIIGSRAIALLAIIAIVACSSDDCDSLTTTTDGKVAVDMVLSVATPSVGRGVTRMSDAITQNDGDFRGIQDLWLVPFKKQGEIASGETPLPLIQGVGLTIDDELDAAKKFFFDPDAMMMQIGTASFLAYGRATVDNGGSFANGSLTASYNSNNNFTPANVTFTPVSISGEAANSTKATRIAEYLSNIAKAGDWYNSPDAGVADLFKNFANIHNSTSEPFAGSTTNILKHVNETYANVENVEEPLKTAIRDAIANSQYVTFDENTHKVTALTGSAYDMTGYPVNLPDGVAGMIWDNNASEFKSQPGNKFENYVYPAELYYYANSRIYTSAAQKKEEYETTDTWETFTTREYENKGTNNEGATVESDTRSIALIDPLQYGVACLEVQIRAGLASLHHTGTGTVALSQSTTEPAKLGTFPLTAILIGGQHIQRFDFTPKYPEEPTALEEIEEDKEYIIYDQSIASENVCLGDYIKGNNANFSKPLYTLTLQTKRDNSVKLVLEFLNNSGSAFKCNSGIIYPDTKFYLMASVVNLETSDLERDKQVLTKDHKSTVRLTISDLSSAYNALPSLSSDKVRLFETVTAGISQWQAGDTPSTEIHNW